MNNDATIDDAIVAAIRTINEALTSFHAAIWHVDNDLKETLNQPEQLRKLWLAAVRHIYVVRQLVTQLSELRQQLEQLRRT